MQEKQVKQPDKAPKVSSVAWKQWVAVSLGVVGSFLLINILIWGIFIDRTYPGVKIGNQNLGNYSRVSVRSQIGSMTQDYELKIVIKGQSKQLRSDDIGLSYDLESSSSRAVAVGKSYVVPLYGLIYTWFNGAEELSYKLNSTKLEQVANKLAGTESMPANDAKVVISGQEVTVQEDSPGRGVDPLALQQLIKQQLAVASKQASIDERPTRAKIDVTEANQAAQQAKKIIDIKLDIQVSGKTFIPDKAEKGKWLAFINKDDKLVIIANNEAINTYVATIAGQVDVAAVNKQINMVNGEVRTVSEGKNGLALDRNGLSSALGGVLVGGQSQSVTGTMNTVAYKTRTNNTVDLNGKYVEVNLSRQHMWVYNDKQLVYDTPVTSGATGAGFPTVQGLFSVKAKQTNRNLNGYAIGYNYNVFVNYWMPFYGNYGMHDASWRSSFGGSDYYYGGSHGCVNLPAAAAAWVYNFVNVGTPVWVHS